MKTRISAFDGTGLKLLLKRLGVAHTAFCGFATTTAWNFTRGDAYDSRQFVDFVIDAMGMPGEGGDAPTALQELVANRSSLAIYSTKEYLAPGGPLRRRQRPTR